MARIVRSRIFRCIICVFLICCFLVNLSPIRAKAAAATATAVVGGVAIGLAVAAGMQALGVRAGTDASTFTSLVNSCVDALCSTWAVDGLVTMLSLTDGSLTRTYASQNFLQAILDFLFDSAIVISANNYVPSSLSDQWANRYAEALSHNYGFFSTGYDSNGALRYSLGYSDTSSFTFSSNCVITTFDQSGFYVTSNLSTSSPPGFTFGYSYNSYRISFTFELIGKLDAGLTTSYDLTLESVGQEIDTDYETYVETGIVSVDFGIQFEDDPNTDRDESKDNDKPYVPVRLVEMTNGNYADQTQAEAQTGQSQVELDYGDGSGGGSDSGTDSGGSSSGSSGDWVSPSDHNMFALGDLSKFFPFCIPFDLFDFFSLLCADPVAPVLSWEIQDLAGNTYPFEIDLSEWDSVALLFRRLQLLLFITGLAAASRKFIKW